MEETPRHEAEGQAQHTVFTPPVAAGMTDANAPGYVLDAVTWFLLGNVFGDYRLTVTNQCERTARTIALAVYSGHVAPLPFSLSVWSGDRPAFVLAQYAGLLLPACTLTIRQYTTPTARTLTLKTDGTDGRLDTLIDRRELPSRSRMDIGYMRRRIASSAEANRTRITRAGERGLSVPEAVGMIAGGVWPSIAAIVIGG
ncbi:hypothetical protein [Bifidobacterium miconisargentati]|uniref:hypothetical protein n=1 Tax=Bifidobacterium miconisargentati TaxID=2834437 RepID=UPI001BDDB581|nr:hypothetical protein [Bifidobacterium miconisargentati]MBW3089590.1 hypothetical protein [Bifidobacterium miconisargentati]